MCVVTVYAVTVCLLFCDAVRGGGAIVAFGCGCMWGGGDGYVPTRVALDPPAVSDTTFVVMC